MAVIPPGLDGLGTNQSIFGVYGCFEFLVARLRVGAYEQSKSDSKNGILPMSRRMVDLCNQFSEKLNWVMSSVDCIDAKAV
jgi:hypothetical protein